MSVIITFQYGTEKKKTSNNHELCFPHFDRMGRQINTNIRDLLRLTATEMTSH